jgi:hypothetical protein
MQLYCKSNPFNDNFKIIIKKYDGRAKQMLRALRDAYLIPTDNSFVLK